MSKAQRITVLASLALLLSLGSFLGGFAYRHKSVWPTRDVLTLYAQFKDYSRTGVWGRQGLFMPAAVAAGASRAVVKDPSRFLPGYRAVMGYDSELETFSLRLLDRDGEQVHVWPLSYRDLAPEPQSSYDINPHGMKILRDGSVVVNFGGGGPLLARVDACGNALWKRVGIYHHSVHSDDKGNLWTWFSPDNIDSPLQRIVAVDRRSGETLRAISLTDVAAASPTNALVLAVPEGFRTRPADQMPAGMKTDMFHPNDVEPLSAQTAGNFEMFEAGDLLISLRNLDLVAVLDPNTLEIKWSQRGPWIRQHDPDFTANGMIEVYDNASGLGRSGIIAIDPSTDQVTRLFAPDGPVFYSESQGKHDRLPSGATLITIPDEGRVIEVAEDGDIIFEFNNIVANGANGRVLNAKWLPLDYFTELPACPASDP